MCDDIIYINTWQTYFRQNGRITSLSDHDWEFAPKDTWRDSALRWWSTNLKRLFICTRKLMDLLATKSVESISYTWSNSQNYSTLGKQFVWWCYRRTKHLIMDTNVFLQRDSYWTPTSGGIPMWQSLFHWELLKIVKADTIGKKVPIVNTSILCLCLGQFPDLRH